AGLLAGSASYSSANAADTIGLNQLFDASQGGNLAAWFSSFAFMSSAVGCVLIYTVRRHKLDDYRGSYRLWLWCAAAWIVMSIDATANLHAPFSRALAKATSWSMLEGGALWWIGVWGTILAILALRLVLELGECRSSQSAILATGMLWAAALAIDYGWFPAIPLEHTVIVAIGCRLLGQVTRLLGIDVYARHVLLDAEGLLKQRPAKPPREKPKKTKLEKQVVAANSAASRDAAKETRRIDPPHKPVLPSSQQTNSAWSANRAAQNRAAAADDEDETDRYDNR